jgi:hypothetical protein
MPPTLESLVHMYHIPRCRDIEDLNMNIHSSKNRKSYTIH